MLPLYLTHHAIVIVVYGLGTFRGRAHFWGAANALCEVTNCFCTVIELFACVSSEAKERWKTLYRWNSMVRPPPPRARPLRPLPPFSPTLPLKRPHRTTPVV